MGSTRALGVVLSILLCGVIAAQVSAQGSNATTKWQTLSGDAPFVVARGGFSGLFPDSSSIAYNLALMTSVPDVILWCDVQLTKDGAGICFPQLKLDNSSDVAAVFPKQQNTYLVNGVQTIGWFSIDFTLKDLSNVVLNQGIYSRTNMFDGNVLPILTVEDVAGQFKPPGLWLNIQHDAFYSQHNLSMRSYVLSVSRRVIVSYISSPEVNFLRIIAARFRRSTTKLVFEFLGETEIEPTTNQTYGSLLKNLTFINTFASGILVPKTYIWPVDPSSNYLLPHTSVVLDAHKNRLEVFAGGFTNDVPISYNYSYDPLAENLQFINNGDFSVDGVLSDFPITPSIALDCFAHLGKNATKQVDLLVISNNGASGDYPSCTDLAYNKAIADGVDIIDCPVQMSKDGIPFCFSSINLIKSSLVAQSPFSNRAAPIPDVMPGIGIFSFSLTWDEIQHLTPAISSPFADLYKLYRNPKFKEAGKFIKLSDFLDLAKNATTLSGVLISIENAAYLAEKKGMSITDAVIEALGNAGYNQTTLKVLIQSTNSSVLSEFKGKDKYELVYKVDENIRDALNSTVKDIQKFAHSVVVNKQSVFPENAAFVTGVTNIVAKLQSFKLSVYVETFQNEFVSQAWDFFSDATVEINSFYMGAGIQGVITDFPKTAARYRRNRCLNRGNKTPIYMSPVKPGSLMQLVTPPYLPPAEAPLPILRDSDVIEPPLPPVSAVPSPTNATAPPPAPSNGQPKFAACIFLSPFATLIVTLLLL